ncbi:MAG TPA: hypothetical protein VMG13_18150 [Trebonia sp.]|nr:hypothetical protein [Trebonia sp.]
MIIATGFLAVSMRPSALDVDHQITDRFPGESVSAMRVRPDDCGLVAANVGYVSRNVGSEPPTVSSIVGQKIRRSRVCHISISGRYTYRPEPGRGRGRPPVLVEESELPPALFPPLTPIQRRSFDYTELEVAMAHLDQVLRQTRRSLSKLGQPPPADAPASEIAADGTQQSRQPAPGRSAR